MTFRLKLAAMIAVTSVAWSSGSAHAWHEKGHMMVAAVAWEQMTPAVRARAIELLKINPDYSKSIAGVADDLKDKTACSRIPSSGLRIHALNGPPLSTRFTASPP